MKLFDQVLRLMRRLEWAGRASGSVVVAPKPTCPLCGGAKPSHDLDCELMALITKMESTPMVARPLGTGERVRAQETHVKAAR